MVDFIQRVSVTMPTPTLSNGQPEQPWTPSVARSDWGKLQLVIAGYGMTKPRGKRFVPLMDAHTEPFGDAEASFAFPGLTDFDDPADWHLTRLAPVRLRRKDPSGNFHTIYEGELASVEPDAGKGLQIQCLGAFYRLDLLKEPPAMVRRSVDMGRLIARAVNRKIRDHGIRLGRMNTVTTGIAGTGSADFQPLVTGHIQGLLSQMTDDDGNQWTIELARPRTPRLVLKDTTTVHATITFGTPGLDNTNVKLSEDFTTGVTAVYGTGSNGHCTWMGARFPNLTETDVPAFPLSVGSVFSPGSATTGFAEFAAFLRRGQYGTIVSDDTYLSADVDNVEQFQQRAGITVDGIVGAQTWEAAFRAGANQGSTWGAYVGTIWEKTNTNRRLYNAQGADVGPNPNFDPTVPRIEDYIPFGDNVSKNLGRKTAKQIVNRDHPVGLTGTITLPIDPEEMSRFALDSGMNLLLKSYRGRDVLLHITRRVRNWDARTVDVTVDEKARDLVTLASIHQRNRDVSDLTKRQKFGRTRSKVFDDYGTWLCEDGAGEIPLMNQQGGYWNVQPIAAAPKGSIERISLALGSGLTEHLLNVNLSDTPNATIPGAARGAIAIFARPITANALATLLGNPTQNDSNDQNPWDREADELRRRGQIFAAGGPGAQIGFFPNDDPGDGTSTNLSGRFEDAGGVQFGPSDYYRLWVAIYTTTSCLVGGRLFPGPPD